MAKDSVLHLRYMGMLAQIGHREYRFQIEAVDQSFRTVALTIDDAIFRNHLLMFQEAPDLCYQKMLADYANETANSPICSRATVTEAEVASYRDSHPIGKVRKTAFR
jgi:hypothetical protein